MNKEGGIYKLSVGEGQKRHKNVDVLSYCRQYAVEKSEREDALQIKVVSHRHLFY